jgi:hypothetical protein
MNRLDLRTTALPETPMTQLSIAIKIPSSWFLQFSCCSATYAIAYKNKKLTFLENPTLAHLQHAGGATPRELFVMGRDNQCASVTQ